MNQPAERRARWHLLVHPATVVPLAIIAVIIVSGGGVPKVLIGVVVAYNALRLATDGRIDHQIARAAVAVAQALGTAAFAIGHVLLVVPAHVVGRRSWRRERSQPPSWSEAPLRRGPADPPRLAASSATDAPARRGGVLAAAGLTVLLLAADLGVGAAWNRISPRYEPPTEPPPTLVNVTGSDAPRDPRSDDPAMGGVPWAEDYFDELNSIRASYWPFVLFRNEPYSGRYVNGSGWTRASWEPSGGSEAKRPLLSFYGGSTTFGIGQRDQHTIPSEVARLAASEGYPVDVRNHGMSGFVSWQEMMLFEHFTDAGERPLRAVFYDGANEVYAQRQPAVFGNPADTETEQIADRLALDVPGGKKSEPVETPDPSLWEQYQRGSAISRVIDDLKGSPAGASPTQDTTELTPEEIGTAAAEVYERSRDLIEAVGDEHGVATSFFWQPVPEADLPTSAYHYATEALGPPTTSVAGCLDDDADVYLTDSHTSERGARLVAACLWEHLGPTVRDWYRDQGISRREPDPEALDDVAPATEVSALPIDAAQLGPGWQAGRAIPNIATACLTAEGAGDATTGPSFEPTGDGIGSLATSVIAFRDPATALQRLAELRDEGGACLQQQASDVLSARDGIRWTEEPGAAGDARWTGEVWIDSIQADAAIRLTVVPDGSSLIVIQAIGTDTASTLAAADTAATAVRSG